MDNKPELTLNTLDVIAAPQRPRSKRQCRKLSAMLAEIESIREAHWPDVLTLGQNVKPQPLLIVVVDKGEDVDAVSHHVSASLKLLSEEKLKHAEALGRALRLGAMLTGSVKGMLNKTRLEIADGELSLILEPGVAHLAGERVERRLTALGNCLGLTSRLVA